MYVINEHKNKAICVPTAGVRAVMEAVVKDVCGNGGEVVINGEEAGRPERALRLLAKLSDEDLPKAVSGILVTDEEGSAGVAVGFSSADRESFAMPWPECLEDDFIGNGDPMVYKTAGVAEGVWIDGYDAAEAEDPDYLKHCAR